LNSVTSSDESTKSKNDMSKDGLELKLIKANEHDLEAHKSRLLDIEERNSIKTLWRELN
jgi:hypothetical protein